MISASPALGVFWPASERRSGTFMLLPTSEPAPSGPWHIAHFARNVALAADLSGGLPADSICVVISEKAATSTATLANVPNRGCLAISPDIRILLRVFRNPNVPRVGEIALQPKPYLVIGRP